MRDRQGHARERSGAPGRDCSPVSTTRLGSGLRNTPGPPMSSAPWRPQTPGRGARSPPRCQSGTRASVSAQSTCSAASRIGRSRYGDGNRRWPDAGRGRGSRAGAGRAAAANDFAPITALAAAAIAIGQEKTYTLPRIEAPPDETGDLVRAFEGMMVRLGNANADLLESNAALRRENEERGASKMRSGARLQSASGSKPSGKHCSCGSARPAGSRTSSSRPCPTSSALR